MGGRRKIHRELSMSANEVTSTIWSRFNYLLCLDLIVFACIIVIAGRPDGLAITVSALILGVGALIYRSTVSVKSYLSRSKTPQRKAEHQFGQRVQPKTAPAAPVAPKPTSKSWLRDSE
jgi:hypothetical protein